MKIKAVKTHAITTRDKSILEVLDKYIKNLKERSIVVVTSKIVSICEGNVVEEREGITKEDLVPKYADWYLPKKLNPWGFCLSIVGNTMVASAGIDASNANGKLVLWPKNPQKSADKIREYLTKRFKLKNIGVIIIDSHTTPLRWGVTGIAIAHSGFKALKKYIGEKDLFGREYVVTNQNIMDGLAASASVVMGEGSECTPLAVIEDLPFVEFQDRNPTKKELDFLHIQREEDLYWPILKNAPWEKGKK